ncbi:hypothetical protein AMECASPLE_011590 [Ameca splendens]|uniref:Uncharacterized protein n=1 Tax=Ameca splendens TaxID=208324 RepID=A0ABV0YC85_9TELE
MPAHLCVVYVEVGKLYWPSVNSYITPHLSSTLLSQRSVVCFHKLIKTNLNSERETSHLHGYLETSVCCLTGGCVTLHFIPYAAMQYTYTIILSVDVSPATVSKK